MDKFNFIVYVEGGFSRDDNKGAFAYIILDGITEEDWMAYSSVVNDTTSNRIYYEGLIAALVALPINSSALVICDATYLTNIMSGQWKAKANLDIIARARSVIQARHLTCKFEWRSIKLKDPIMKRVWRMCSDAANVNFEQLYEARDKK